jgi:hypothetical protein
MIYKLFLKRRSKISDFDKWDFYNDKIGDFWLNFDFFQLRFKCENIKNGNNEGAL